MQLHRHASDVWEIGGGRQQVVRQRGVQELRIVVINQVVEKNATKPLDDSAECLSVYQCRINGAANILNRDIIENRDMTGARVDRNMGGMCAITVGPFVIRESAGR